MGCGQRPVRSQARCRLAGSRAPQPAAITANLEGAALIAWQQHADSGQREHWWSDAAIVQTPHTHTAATIVGVAAQRVPGTLDAAGATPAIGLDANGEAVVLFNRSSCDAAPTCGMYASTRARTGWLAAPRQPPAYGSASLPSRRRGP
ncbi:MAG: hypothetical protein ACYCUM_08795 [Solirubrobacteraceae bacterium]